MFTSNPKKEVLAELKKENKQNWYLIINRPGIPPLDFSLTFTSFPRINTVLETNWTIELLKWQDDCFYISEKDKQKLLQFLGIKLEKEKDFILKLLKQGEEKCNELMAEADKYESTKIKYFKKMFELVRQTGFYFRIVLKLEILLQKKYPNIKFLPPIKDNFITKFHKELLGLRNKKWNETDINNLLKKYYWITIFHYTGKYLTTKDIKEKLKSIKVNDVNINKSSPPKDKDEMIYRTVIFLRTHLAESFEYHNAKAKPLLEELAKEYNVTYEDLTYITGDELIQSLENKKLIVSKNEIKSRQKRFGLIMYKYNLFILNKDECEIVFGKLKKEKEKGTILKGLSACKGKIRGKVCIIKNFHDFSKFKPNDILVTYSTTPNFIMLMHLAKAFLTQEGGITSHAAIVSREMNKPCIVGIKNLIDTLRDGNFIEVDADKGEVKIINP